MPHTIITTDAYILRINADGEQSLRILLATKDQGLIAAGVQSGASLASKHRALISVGRHVVVDMVRGYRGYILTGIKEIPGPEQKLAALFLSRIGAWAMHYLGIETSVYRELYDLSKEVVQILSSPHTDTPEWREALSLWILESLLSLGGYREHPVAWSEDRMHFILESKPEIKAALEATHLRTKNNSRKFVL
jgi:hypothetical protein